MPATDRALTRFAYCVTVAENTEQYKNQLSKNKNRQFAFVEKVPPVQPPPQLSYCLRSAVLDNYPKCDNRPFNKSVGASPTGDLPRGQLKSTNYACGLRFATTVSERLLQFRIG